MYNRFGIGVVGIIGLMACSSSGKGAGELPPAQNAGGDTGPGEPTDGGDGHVDTGGVDGSADGTVDSGGGGGSDSGVDTGDGGGGSTADVEFTCGAFVMDVADNFGDSQYYGWDYLEGEGGNECLCTLNVPTDPGGTPIGVTIYQSADSIQSGEWGNSVASNTQRYAPAFVHLTLPNGTQAESRSDVASVAVENMYYPASNDWRAFPDKTATTGNDGGFYNFSTPFSDERPFAGDYFIRLSLVNAGTTAPSGSTPTEERKDTAFRNCSTFYAQPLTFRIDTTASEYAASGADPTSVPGSTSFTEVKLDNLLSSRTFAFPISGAVGIVGAEAKSVQVMSWRNSSWVELRDRQGRVHRLSPSRPSLELPPGTGTVESLEWRFGNDDPIAPISSGPTLRLRHRGQASNTPGGGFRVSWRNLLAAAGRALGGELAIPEFNPLPDWTALRLQPSGLAPGQEDPTLTVQAPLAGTLFTLPLTPGPDRLYSWSFDTPIARLSGRFQEQSGPRVGLWVDRAEVASPFGALTLLPSHLIVEMAHANP